MTATTLPRATASSGNDEDIAYARVTWRLVPLLFICYVAACQDRVNVGFAKLQMLSDLKFSESIYGLGAGIFFIGYFLFEVPSNLLLHKLGARRWIARILISWGLISGCMMFVQTPTMFYVLRFLLGVAEAGFFPGITLHLTCWYPLARRSKVTSPSGISSPATIGWLVAIPYSAAVACMILTSRHSDRTGERRWHIAIPALVGAAALVVSTFVPQTPLWAIVTLTVATMGSLTALAQFWVLPPAFLGGAAAAAGIALINSVGNLAGFVSPFAVGWIKDATGSTNKGLYVIAASLVAGSAIVLSIAQRGATRRTA